MKHFLLVLALLLPVNSFAVNGSGNVSNVIGYGLLQSATGSGPLISTSDITKFYAVSCGFSTSSVTAGRHYRCFKQAGNSSTDWTVSSTKTAYCPMHYFGSNITGSLAYSFGYGTVAVTNDSATNPTGDVPFNVAGAGFMTNAPTQVAAPVSIPVSFSGSGAGATITPYLLMQSGGGYFTAMLLCQDI